MTTKEEKKETKEMYPGSELIQETKEMENDKETVISQVRPYQVLKIIQNIYPPSLPPSPTPKERYFPPIHMWLIEEMFDILDQLRQLIPDEMDIVLSLVKDLAIAANLTGKPSDLFYTGINLSYYQWCDIIKKAKSASKAAPTTATVDKLLEITIKSRKMNKDEYENYKSSFMKSTIFKDERDKLNHIEIVDQVRSITAGDYETLLEMLVDPGIPAHAAAKKELKKIYNHLKELTPVQAKTILGMVKDSSITKTIGQVGAQNHEPTNDTIKE